MAPAVGWLELLNDSKQTNNPIGRLQQPNQLFGKQFFYDRFHRAILNGLVRPTVSQQAIVGCPTQRATKPDQLFTDKGKL